MPNSLFFILGFALRRVVFTNRKFLLPNPLATLSQPLSMTSKVWNIPQLRKQSERMVLRQVKKVTKAEKRYKAAFEKDEFDAILPLHLAEVESTQEQLRKLSELETDIMALTKKGNIDDKLEGRIIDVGLSDEIPEVKPRVKKVKKPKPPSRQPFKSYQSEDGTSIQVGRSASDNDTLSLGAARATPNNWWLHAGGAAGSHVVVGFDGAFAAMNKATLQDAAVLALKFSKAGHRGKVTVTKCGNIFKPKGAVDGLVGISGDVKSIRVDLKTEEDRLARLESQLKG